MRRKEDYKYTLVKNPYKFFCVCGNFIGNMRFGTSALCSECFYVSNSLNNKFYYKHNKYRYAKNQIKRRAMLVSQGLTTSGTVRKRGA